MQAPWVPHSGRVRALAGPVRTPNSTGQAAKAGAAVLEAAGLVMAARAAKAGAATGVPVGSGEKAAPRVFGVFEACGAAALGTAVRVGNAGAEERFGAAAANRVPSADAGEPVAESIGAGGWKGVGWWEDRFAEAGGCIHSRYPAAGAAGVGSLQEGMDAWSRTETARLHVGDARPTTRT